MQQGAVRLLPGRPNQSPHWVCACTEAVCPLNRLVHLHGQPVWNGHPYRLDEDQPQSELEYLLYQHNLPIDQIRQGEYWSAGEDGTTS